jgi:CIC family chloride channel protein
MALWLPEVLGVGYEATDRVLGNQYELQFVLILAIAKAVATALCLGSSFGGGIFSPSLVLGAMVGAAFGMVAYGLFPALGSNASVYAILGMGAVAACILGAPISTVIMVFELTTDYGVAFAVMVWLRSHPSSAARSTGTRSSPGSWRSAASTSRRAGTTACCAPGAWSRCCVARS